MSDDKLLLAGSPTYASVSDQISGAVLRQHAPRAWYVGFFVGSVFMLVFIAAVSWLFYEGVGIWGINVPVAWGFAIVNFVWWIGIGHAGTFISAILLLFRQKWRTSINRFSEAMTLFAVVCAGMFPLLHLGRPQFFYWLFPYPDTMRLWPQFKSPLVWDVFAVSTYALVSLMFWFLGLMPDLAVMRDRAKNHYAKLTFGVLAMGWRGSARHWQNYEKVYLLMAGIATPLVISVHSVVSLDFSVAQVPGWHSTIFPPYFVAGAIYSGFAMVLTLILPIRAIYKMENLITEHHVDMMVKVMMTTGLIVAYGYIIEAFDSWFSGNPYEQYMMLNRFTGPYALEFWILIACNLVIPQLCWFNWIRRHTWVLFAVALVINVGMWLERFIIVVTSLHRDFLPSSWGIYTPTIWDWATLLGSMGLFMFLLFTFVRVLPMVSINEVNQLVHQRLHSDSEHV